MRRVLIVIGVMAIAAAGASAALQSTAAATCPRLQTAPTIDGRIGAAEWAGAAAVAPFVLQGGGMPSLVTEAYLGYDDDALYIAARLRDPAPAQMQCVVTERDGAVQADPSFTVMLDPGNDGVGVITLAVNSVGVELDAIDGDSTQTLNWRSATNLDEHGWTVEIAYPFGPGGAPAVATRWGLNVLRHAPRVRERSSMTGAGLGTLGFGRPELRADVEPIDNPWFGQNTLPVRLANLSAAPQTVKVNVRVSGDTRRAHFFDVTKLTLGGGEVRDLAVSYQVLRGGRGDVELSVQAIEGDVAFTALRTADMSFELPPLGRLLDAALSDIARAYQTYVRIPLDARPFDGASQLDMLLARWRYLDSQQQRQDSLTPDVMMALVNRAQALAEDAVLIEKEFHGLLE
ncbi:MAG: hypothetical protein ACOX9R_17995 [Armatimonadota bacterium]|jgi:hypothetical protein